jgi:hypothetical protein
MHQTKAIAQTSSKLRRPTLTFPVVYPLDGKWPEPDGQL